MWKYFTAAGVRGINIDGKNEILLLAYADDLALLCNFPTDFRKEIVLLHQYCTRNDLEVNQNKTKVLQFHKGRQKI